MLLNLRTVRKKRDKQNIQKFWCEKVINKKYFNFCKIFTHFGKKSRVYFKINLLKSNHFLLITFSHQKL